MNETDIHAPAAAVQIAIEAMRDIPWRRMTVQEIVGHQIAALAHAGWLHDPERVTELEAELVKARGYQMELAERCYRKDLELDAWRTGEAS